MNVFVIELENKPGELAALLERLAEAEVNVMLAGTATTTAGTVTLVADHDAAAEQVLRAGGYRFGTTSAIKVRAANRPGEGAVIARTLADAGVNIQLILPMEITPQIAILVLGVDSTDKAEAALADRVIPD